MRARARWPALFVLVLSLGCRRSEVPASFDAGASASATTTAESSSASPTSAPVPEDAAAVGAASATVSAVTCKGACGDDCPCRGRTTCIGGVCKLEPTWKIEELALSDSFACARYASGAIWCAGMNGSGQLGRGIDGAMDPTLFEKVQGAAPALGKKATQIVVGRDHACMRAGGDVSCWGSGSEGELGWGIFRADPSPQVVFGVNDASALASGDRHTCAVVKSGAEVVCWGNNRAGQLGDGTTEKRAMPVVVKGVTGVTALALGLLHSCALKKDGAVVCWGSTGAAGGAPLVVAGLPRVDQITAALNATCARSGKTVRCWGGGHGEKPTVEEYFSGATTIVGDHILGGRELVCAIVDAGEVHCVMPGESYRITNDEDPKTRTRARLVAVGGGNGCYVRDDGVDRIDCDETLKVRPVVEKL